MNHWFSKTLAALSLSLMLSATASAASHCAPCAPACDPCDSCFGAFDVGVDFLFWKPCVDDLTYASILSGDGSEATPFVFDDKGVCPSWEPGFRVYMGKEDVLCGWNFLASFTWVSSCDNAHASTPMQSIYPTLAHAALLGDGQAADPVTGITGNLFNEASAHWSAKYYAWDLLLEHPLECCGPCFTFSPFIGVSGIVLKQEFNSELQNTLDTGATATTLLQTQWNANYWGVGLKFGSNMNYEFNDCISMYAAGSVEILAGKASKGENSQSATLGDSTVVSGANFKDGDCCLIVPGYHIAAGFRYASDWCGNDFGIRLGYEFLEYHNVPNQRIFMGDQPATQAALSTSASTRTLGFHGLMVGADVSF